MKRLQKPTVFLVFLSVSISLTSCSKPSTNQNGTASSLTLPITTTAGSPQSFPFTDTDLAISSTNPTVPAPAAPDEKTPDSDKPTPEEIQQSTYVFKECIVNGLAHNFKNGAVFSVRADEPDYCQYNIGNEYIGTLPPLDKISYDSGAKAIDKNAVQSKTIAISFSGSLHFNAKDSKPVNFSGVVDYINGKWLVSNARFTYL